MINGSYDNYYNKTFWCFRCNVPLLTEKCYRCNGTGTYVASDIKPVFSEERKFWEDEIEEFNENGYKLPLNLFYGRRRVVYNGQTLFTIRIDDGRIKLGKNNIDSVGSVANRESENQFRQRMVKANEPVIRGLEKSSISFIKKMVQEHPHHKKFISFSGGKDSTVAAIVVKKAIGPTPLFFSDTTLEIPDTYKYVKEFAREYEFELITEKSHNNFFKMCDLLEPPSHIMRWCCTVFKAYPVNKFLRSISGNILTFDGIRKAESSVRASYPQLYKNKKIVRQTVARPIFVWSTLSVWMYILKRKIMYNPAYRNGYTRVGCYLCPFNSPYDDVITKHFYPELYDRWEKVLIDFAKNHNKDLRWVDSGYWKQRKPNRKNYKVVTPKLCPMQNTYRYIFEDCSVTNDAIEFLKPFGNIDFKTSNFFQIETNNPFKLNGLVGGSSIKVTFNSDLIVKTKFRLERQIEKSMNCVACGGCIGTCPNGAISVTDKFRIDDEKCTHCLDCVDTNFTSRGCIALSFKEERKRIASSVTDSLRIDEENKRIKYYEILLSEEISCGQREAIKRHLSRLKENNGKVEVATNEDYTLVKEHVR
ncbi:MAG: phosphoadenosine phosphosulfate reductase family protein [Nanoarchaeota archaeon]|nr:phosphoadenosine phosphosulfate reductase family protein [Nanoarchaeota archaeon]MCG2718592.1 phosphoadenosine phosphosulfate reductase family protein [Nanoarchaeota archaeon]